MAYLPTLMPLAAQRQQSMSPPLMSQRPMPNLNNGTAAGGVASMVNAIMAGQGQFDQRRRAAMQQAQGAQQLNPTTTTGGSSVGAPMSLAPPTPPVTPPSAPIPPVMVDPGPMTGSMTGTPMPGMPNGIDPSMRALFSQIPGEGSQPSG